ncbi:MAG: hypothetical protein NVSMB18_14010 [Acetobacteraceae bacterium]
MTVHLDVSQLLRDPRRSGIQRAERELIRHWPGPDLLVPCRFDPAVKAMRELPVELLAAVIGEAAPGGVAAERRRLEGYARPGRVLPDGGVRLLCAELFDDFERAAFYRGPAGSAAYWVVYDFLPWLAPGWFAAGPGTELMPYLYGMQAVRHLAFISHATRKECAARILRRPCAGPVIPMGADGLGLERQHFERDRRDIVMLGTIESRKNAALALRAFRQLWSEGIEARLVLIGSLEKDALEEQALLRELRDDARLVHLEGLADDGVRDALAGARAMLFPSQGEGYGIPPMEALHAGIPVIVAADLPALEGQPGLGQIRLDPVNAETVAVAVRTVLEDGAASRLWDEAARLQVPTWRDFAHAVALWVQEGGRADPARS